MAEFNKAVFEVLGYDGVVHTFDDGQVHYVAFFPEQIEIVATEKLNNTDVLLNTEKACEKKHSEKNNQNRSLIGQISQTADPSLSIHLHRTVQLELLANHGRAQDFEEGDLLHRLDRFDAFVLKKVDISRFDLNEFNIDQEKVDEFKTLCLEKITCPPVIFDAIDGSIIDGAHRVNALNQLGILQIDAYVGELAHADPIWVSANGANEFESDDEKVHDDEDDKHS